MKQPQILSQSEREVFELICVDAVNMGSRTLDEITDRAKELLKARREQWSTVLSRATNLRRRVYEALRRSTDRRHIQQGPDRDKNVTWEPHLAGHQADLVIIDEVKEFEP